MKSHLSGMTHTLAPESQMTGNNFLYPFESTAAALKLEGESETNFCASDLVSSLNFVPATKT
jgi:hypothetical protein